MKAASERALNAGSGEARLIRYESCATILVTLQRSYSRRNAVHDVRRDAWLTPLARRLGENLDRGCTDRLASNRRPFDATLDRYMSAQALRRTQPMHLLLCRT